MNSPIFNPTWFYLIELFRRFGTALFIIGLLGLIVGGILLLIRVFIDEERPSSWIIGITIASAVLLCISGFIPSEDTCYKMIVTSYVTPNNIESANEEIIGLIDYIVDKIDELSKD